MADMEARREARRRKILQNSENRMNRLLGKAVSSNEDVPAQTDSISTTSSGVLDPNPVQERRDLPLGRTATTDRPDTAAPVVEETVLRAGGDTGTAVSDDLQRHTEGVVRRGPHRGIPADRQKEEDKHASGESASPIKTAKNMFESPVSVRTEPAGQVDALKMLDLMRCGGCLLSAFLTRWALTFGLGLLFLECAVIPFLILEGSLLYFQTAYMKDLQLPHQSSLMAYALILSGVKQELLVKYNKIMGYFTAVTEDFSLYLFAFLICNALIS